MSDILEIQSHCSEMEDNEVVQEKLHFSAKRRKGRGFDYQYESELGKIKHFDSLNYDSSNKKQDCPQQSIEGWVLFATGLHEEANEEDVKSLFSEYGQVSNIAVNIDRRTGFLKGYALIEYKTYEEAFEAKENLDETTLLDRELRVNWAFVQKPIKRERRRILTYSVDTKHKRK